MSSQIKSFEEGIFEGLLPDLNVFNPLMGSHVGICKGTSMQIECFVSGGLVLREVKPFSLVINRKDHSSCTSFINICEEARNNQSNNI